MRISVVIPCYRSTRRIEESVASALGQTLPPLEILCVDDASPDDTWEALLSLEKKTEGLVRPIRHETNRGPAAARNTGVRAAKGDWIAFLDHDDLWLPEKLERQAEYLRDHPETGLLHSDAWVEPHDAPDNKRRAHEGRHVPDNDPFPALFRRCFIMIPTVMVRRDILESVGGFREDLASSVDYDLWLRLALRGIPFGHVTEPLAVWRPQSNSMTANRLRIAQGELRLLERLSDEDPEVERRIGKRFVRARLLWLRLGIAHAMLEAGRNDDAMVELEKAWTMGPFEPRLWRLRATLALRGIAHPNAVRAVRKASRYFRDSCREN
jgi:glycosyltransferase involved in cell wall biosynthesis